MVAPSDPALLNLIPKFRRIAVVINARPTKLDFEVEALKHFPLTLHPVQESSSDIFVQKSKFEPSVGTFGVPSRTTVVFVERSCLQQGRLRSAAYGRQQALGGKCQCECKLR